MTEIVEEYLKNLPNELYFLVMSTTEEEDLNTLVDVFNIIESNGCSIPSHYADWYNWSEALIHAWETAYFTDQMRVDLL